MANHLFFVTLYLTYARHLLQTGAPIHAKLNIQFALRDARLAKAKRMHRVMRAYIAQAIEAVR